MGYIYILIDEKIHCSGVMKLELDYKGQVEFTYVE